MLSRAKSLVAGIATAAMIGAGTLAAVPAEAAPAYQGYVQDVRYDGPYPYKYHKHWDNHDHWGHHGSNNWVGPLIGGLIIGGIAAEAAQGSYGYGGYGYGSHDAYCHQRFRSYNSGSHSYLGYDGFRHPC